MLLLLLACESGTPAHPAGPVPDSGGADSASDSGDSGDSGGGSGECGTWATVGHPFVLTYCTSCHSSRLSGSARYGAPEGADFDTLAAVRTDAARFAARALADPPDMPPRGSAPAADRAAMQAWLTCGAPGEEAPLPVGSTDTSLVGSVILTGGVEAEEGALVLYAEEGDEAWAEQAFVTDDGVGALLDSVRFEAGVEAEAVQFDPPLAVYDPVNATLTETVAVTRSGAGGTTTAAEAWTVTREVVTDPDPRLLDTAPTRVIAVHDGIPELEWWFSSTRMLVAQATRYEDGRWAVLLHQVPGELRPADAEFPLESGGSWASRGYWTTEAP